MWSPVSLLEKCPNSPPLSPILLLFPFLHISPFIHISPNWLKMEKEQYGENVEKSLALAAADPYGRDAKRKLNLGNQAII